MRQRRYEMQKCNNDKNIVIWDNETGECLGFTAQIKGRLNLQDAIIKEQEQKIAKLVEENKQLQERIRELESTLADDISLKYEIKEAWKQRTENG